MDPMVAFVRARLDEDAAIATSVHGRFDDLPGTTWWNAGEVKTVLCDDQIWMHDAEHIARHSPARVLREVEVKRKTVEKHGPTPPGYTWVGDDDDLMPACRVCGDLTVAFPCPTLRLVASVYDDHPDYLPEWKIA